MLQVENNIIFLTKGDEGVLPVDVTIHDGTAYEMGESDFLTLSVRRLPAKDSPLLMQAKSNHGSNHIIIPAEATADMEPGKYSADIQLTDASGRPYTVWPNKTEVEPNGNRSFNNFYLTPEVTV